MTAKIIDGRTIAAQIKQEIKTEISKLGRVPGLAVILVGADPASHLYVNLKEKACAEVGIHFEKYLFFATEPEDKIIAKINELNARANIHGILVQVPLPSPLSENQIISAISPAKDVDGFHAKNLALVLSGHPRIIPGVALGILRLIEETKVPLKDKTAVLLVNSTTFAAPIEFLLKQKGMVTQVLLAPADLSTISDQLKNADVFISAIGRSRAIKAEMIKSGAIIIDVGTNHTADGTLTGDVDFETVKQKAGAITPVPGGVGPMTVVMLLKNVVTLVQST